MTGIARFVQDKDLKKDPSCDRWSGDKATRAGIIELLFKRGFLTKKGRYIHSTDAGKALFHSLPEMATRPDMTAHWGIGADANQRKAVSLPGLYAAAGGDIVPVD